MTNFWVRTPDTHSMYIWSFSHVIDNLLSHLWHVLYLTKTASTQHVLFSQECPQKMNGTWVTWIYIMDTLCCNCTLVQTEIDEWHLYLINKTLLSLDASMQWQCIVIEIIFGEQQVCLHYTSQNSNDNWQIKSVPFNISKQTKFLKWLVCRYCYSITL